MQDLAERRLTHFVGGAWRAPLSQRMAGGARGRMVLAEPVDLARAMAAALAAAPAWAALGAKARADLLASAGLDVPPFLPSADPAPLLRFSLPRSLARLLAQGHALVLVLPRPAPAPLLGQVEALRLAGLPSGVLNLLNGRRSELAQTEAARRRV